MRRGEGKQGLRLLSILICSILGLSVLGMVDRQAQAITAPTITTKQTFTNSGGAANFDRVWVNSTHAIMLAQAAGVLYKYTYKFSDDTITTGSITISHGLRVCNQGFGVSSVQTDGTVFVFCKVSGTTSGVVGKYNVSGTLTKITAANITLGAAAHLPLDTEVSKYNVYTFFNNGAGASVLGNMTRAFGSFTQTAASGANSNIETDSGEGRLIVYSGTASASTDVAYAFGINTELEVSRWGGGAVTGNNNCGASQTNTPMTVYPLFDRIIVIAISKTFEILNTGTTCTQLYPTTFAIRPIQGVTMSASVHTYSSTLQQVLGNSTQVVGYIPSTSTAQANYLYPETISSSGGVGTITGIDEPKFYVLNTDHFVSSTTLTGTSWIVKEVTNKSTEVNINPYSEFLNIPVVANNTIVWYDLVHMLCDANYVLPNPKMYLNSDSDCVDWRIIPTRTDSIGRTIPYDQNSDLIHTNPQTIYTMILSAAQPDLYFMRSIYDGFDVDTGAFDSGGALGQFYLYGQCYTAQIEEESTGNILQTGNICANDVTEKTISLSGISIPDDWLGTTWSHTIDRTYNNGTVRDDLLFTYAKNVIPYNASLHVYDNVFDAPTFDQWYNVTGATANVIVNVTSIYSNQTIYFDLYERSTGNATVTLVVQDVSAAKVFTYGEDFADFGLVFGIPAVSIFPILVGFIFPRSIAYFGSIVTVAVIGIMMIFGFITLPIWFWGLAIPLLALSVFMGNRSRGA